MSYNQKNKNKDIFKVTMMNLSGVINRVYSTDFVGIYCDLCYIML